MHAVAHALIELYGSEGIVVRLEAAAGTHAAESRYLADAGAAAVAFGAHPAARLHHFAGTVAHLLVGHFARQRANRFFGLFFSVRSVNGNDAGCESGDRTADEMAAGKIEFRHVSLLFMTNGNEVNRH